MNISNHQILHIVGLLMMVIILIHNNTSKTPIKPLSWNVLCFIVILNILLNMYKTYNKENTKVKVI